MLKDRLAVESLEHRNLLAPVVALIDSGLDINHTSLQNYVWKNPNEIANNIDDDNNGYVDDINGWNFVDNNNIVSDGYGHGTHVGGIISSYGPVEIMVLKFQDSNGVGFTGDAIKAINYAVMMKINFGVDIVAINNSWGGSTGYSSLLEGAIQKANDANIVFVVAAGNNGSDNDIVPRYPSSYSQNNIISVAAVDSNGVLAGFSNYGKNSVDIGALGVSVYSTLPNNSYGYMSGTSMAAPKITGAVASVCYKYGNLSVAEIKNKIFSSIGRDASLIDKVATNGYLNSTNITQVVQPSPIVVRSWGERIVSKIEVANIYRVKGWVLDSDNIHDRIKVKVFINDRLVGSVDAKQYRKELRGYNDSYHGFSLRLSRKMFNKGWNVVRVVCENSNGSESKLIASRNIKRLI